MEPIYLFAPQWQGSGLTRELYDGALALRDYIAGRYGIEPVELGIDTENTPVEKHGILGYELITNQLLEIHQTLEKHLPQKSITIGGGCGIEVPIVSYHLSRNPDTAVFWFDAHGDLNSPDTSPSGHFHGMPLRFLLDDLVLSEQLKIKRVSRSNLILLGTRDLDPPEKNYVDQHMIRLFGPSDFPLNKSLRGMISLPNVRKAYIHIDLDVLDPDCYRNVKCPAADGITIEDLYLSILEIKDKYEIVGTSILENTELDPAKIGMLAQVFDECFNTD